MSVEPECWEILGEQESGPACEVVLEQSSSECEDGAETPENLLLGAAAEVQKLQKSPWWGFAVSCRGPA